MNRFLIPLTATALAAGVAIPGFFGRRTIERVVAEPVQTVVREIYHETPIVYTDTVYMTAEDPAPTQPVYVEEHNDYEYNQYNEYNHTDIDVHQRVVVPPQRREPGWSPRDDGQQPRDRSGYNRPRERRDPPNVPVPKPPVRRTYAPAASDPQNPPLAPTPQCQPVEPKRQAPKRGGVPATTVRREGPKQARTPRPDKPAGAQSDVAKVQVGNGASKVVAPASSTGQQVAASPSQSAADGR